MGRSSRWLLVFVLFSPGLMAQSYVLDPYATVTEHSRTLLYPFAGGLNNPQFWNIQLDNDGLTDLLVFDRNGGKVLTFRNTGTNWFYAPEYEYEFPAMEHFVVTADFNCDGLEDLFTSFDDGVSVYKAVPEGSNISYVLETEKLEYEEIGFSFDVGVGIIDIPAFVDVNGDGDLDMLTFKLIGGFVDYFENQAVENGQPCTLQLEHVNSCWGDFYESGITKAVQLDSSCSETPVDKSMLHGMHAGSTFLVFDEDADGDMDLVLGDLSFQNLNKLVNGGDASLAHIVEQDTVFPGYDIPVDMTTFPAPFLLDVDLDGRQDLLVSPNKEGFSINTHNVSYYRNVSVDDTFVFQFQEDSLFVSDMVDVGSEAHATFFDHNNDGLLDIVIGNYGYFNAGTFNGKLALYENTGTADAPSWTLMTRNYADLEIYGFRGLHPTFGDINGDGKTDMLVGEENGFVHYFKNIAADGADATFILAGPNFQGIDVGKYSTPQLVDVNGDELLDLIIGEENGNLNYYENTGTATDPVFTLLDELWGSVDVRKPLTLTGYSTPWLTYDADGNAMLLVGCLAGSIFQYTPTPDFSGAFTKVTEDYAAIDDGDRTTVCTADLDGDGILEILTGNDRGGITLYRDASTIVQTNEVFVPGKLHPFPQPAADVMFLSVSDQELTHLFIYDLTGKLVECVALGQERPLRISLEHIMPGMYVLNAADARGWVHYTGKLIRQ